MVWYYTGPGMVVPDNTDRPESPNLATRTNLASRFASTLCPSASTILGIVRHCKTYRPRGLRECGSVWYHTTGTSTSVSTTSDGQDCVSLNSFEFMTVAVIVISRELYLFLQSHPEIISNIRKYQRFTFCKLFCRPHNMMFRWNFTGPLKALGQCST